MQQHTWAGNPVQLHNPSTASWHARRCQQLQAAAWHRAV